MFFITMKILQCSSSCILTLSIILSWLILINPIILVSSECTCDLGEDKHHNNTEAMKYKIGAIISILVAGVIGVSLPLLGKKIPALQPEKDIFFLIKAFAAGVMLATGFIHILPDAFNDLTSPCLKQNPWGDFPFTGFITMMSAILTLMVDTLATGYYKRSNLNKPQPVNIGSDEEQSSGGTNDDDHHIHGHSHGSTMVVSAMVVSAENSSPGNSVDLIRHRVTSQVLELGIVAHSVIVGITVGVSDNPSTIKPLFAALTFHQFFEGMGLGSFIAQAKFKSQAIFTMGLFFSFTTPIGIGIGSGISHVYNESSPTALIIQGTLNAAAAGILIYMSLVDILAADFMSPKIQSNGKLQFASYVSLLLGTGVYVSFSKMDLKCEFSTSKHELCVVY